MKLFVGLGNPGDKYAGHRHNVGFMVVERIARSHGFGPWKRKFQGLVAEGELDGEKILLLKPDTYMNESGRSVGEAVRFLKIEVGDVVVFHDELDLAPGKIRSKVGGGNAGHNGLRSLTRHIGNEYVRVRIGIGHPGSKDAVQSYVLHDFSREETSWLEPLLNAMAEASPRLARGNNERYLTDVALATQTVEPAQAAQRRSSEQQTHKPSARDVPGIVKPALSGGHPSGERDAKRKSALAENLRKWLAGRHSPHD